MTHEEAIILLLLRGALVLIAAHFAVSFLLRRLRASATRWVWASLFGLLLLLPATLHWNPWQISISSKAETEQLPQARVETVQPEVPGPFAALEAQADPAPPLLMDALPIEADTASDTAPRWWLGAWLAGVICVLAFISCGHLLLWLIVRKARPANREWLRDSARISSRQIPILVHERVRVPTTAGVWRPKILIPPSAEIFHPNERRATLTHELAHIRSRDPLLILAAQCALALHWCNPLAWVAFRALRYAQERCCDDAVIGSGGAPGDYAELLLGIASRGSNSFPASAGFALPMAQRSSLNRRIRLILDDSMKRKTLTKIQKLGLGIAVVAIASPLALTGIGTTTAHAIPGGEEEVSTLQAKLESITIERIEFTGATLEEGTNYLRRVIEKQGHDPVNFIILRSAKSDPNFWSGQNLEKLNIRAEVMGARLEEMEKKFGALGDRASLSSELARLRANLESTETDYKLVKDLSPEEIAAARPDAEFVRAAFKSLHPGDEAGIEKLEKRCEEYRSAFKKRLLVEQRAYQEFAKKVASSGDGLRKLESARADYQQAEAAARAAATGGASKTKEVGLIDLDLNKISLAAALEYIAQQAGVEVSVQPEAVVFGRRDEIDGLEKLPEKEAAPDEPESKPVEEKEAAPDEPERKPVKEKSSAAVHDGRDPADVYLQGYLVVQEAEALEAKREYAAALKEYRDASVIFSDLKERWPLFEPEMVNFRLRKIAEASAKVEAAVTN